MELPPFTGDISLLDHKQLHKPHKNTAKKKGYGEKRYKNNGTKAAKPFSDVWYGLTNKRLQILGYSSNKTHLSKITNRAQLVIFLAKSIGSIKTEQKNDCL